MRGKWALILASLLLGAAVSAQQVRKGSGESKGVPKVSITVTGHFLNAQTGEIKRVTLKASKGEKFPPAPWEFLVGEVYEVTLTVHPPTPEKGGKPDVFNLYAKFEQDGRLKLGKAAVVKMDGKEWQISLTLRGRFINAMTGEIVKTTVQLTELGWSDLWQPLVDEVYETDLNITPRPPGEWDISAKAERDKYGRLWVVIYGTNTRTGERREFGRLLFREPSLGVLVVTARKGDDGKPLGGATVVVYEKGKEGKLVEVARKRTDGKGTARFPLKAGKYVVDISYPMRCHWQEEVEVKRGEIPEMIKEIGFVLYQHYYGVPIKVTFRDPWGNPAPWGSAELRWWLKGRERPENPCTKVGGPEGEYTAMLGPGDWMIEAKCTNTGETQTTVRHIEEHQHVPLSPVGFGFAVPRPRR